MKIKHLIQIKKKTSSWVAPGQYRSCHPRLTAHAFILIIHFIIYKINFSLGVSNYFNIVFHHTSTFYTYTLSVFFVLLVSYSIYMDYENKISNTVKKFIELFLGCAMVLNLVVSKTHPSPRPYIRLYL